MKCSKSITPWLLRASILLNWSTRSHRALWAQKFPPRQKCRELKEIVRCGWCGSRREARRAGDLSLCGAGHYQNAPFPSERSQRVGCCVWIPREFQCAAFLAAATPAASARRIPMQFKWWARWDASGKKCSRGNASTHQRIGESQAKHNIERMKWQRYKIKTSQILFLLQIFP